MQRIEGTKLVILDQTLIDNEKYVKVKDLVQYLGEGIERAKKSRKTHAKYFRKAWQVIQNKMIDLQGRDDDVPVNLPKRLVTSA